VLGLRALVLISMRTTLRRSVLGLKDLNWFAELLLSYEVKCGVSVAQF
jgi:hypothetical protein